jgi:carbamoyl-phosphate synthase large subunit
MEAGDVALLVNTPEGAESFRDSFPIRRAALECRVPYFTTMAAAAAAAEGIELMRRGPFGVRPLQEYHPGGRGVALARGAADRSE